MSERTESGCLHLIIANNHSGEEKRAITQSWGHPIPWLVVVGFKISHWPLSYETVYTGNKGLSTVKTAARKTIDNAIP